MTFNNTKKNNSIRKSIRFRRTTIPYNNNKINKNLDINKKKEELKDINECITTTRRRTKKKNGIQK